MELAMGAMSPLFPKLFELLKDKYVAQSGLKREIESLTDELEMIHAAFVEVSKVPADNLSEPDKCWARKVRELSYDMEDTIDAFMVRVAAQSGDPSDASVFKKFTRKATKLIKKIKDRHQLSDKIQDIKNIAKELGDLCTRYSFSSCAPPKDTGVDPRVINLYKNEGQLVGIEESRDELIRRLTYPKDHKSLKIVSVVGTGGLGKTTLAKLVFDQLIKEQSFDCSAFVSVGRNPNVTNTLREMLEKLGKMCSSDMGSWSPQRSCEELRKILQDKRYIVVVDDVWENETWKAISYALPDSNHGSRVILTTRKYGVGAKANDVYKLQPLSPEKSKELFYKRTSNKNGDNQLAEVSDRIINKCDGVPLAIIAIASLLADRPCEDWQKLYESIIFGSEVDKTRTILLYSYYDLPPYLKPCLLYLSMYPEDDFIEKSPLIWRWIAEGFVQIQHSRGSLFEIGETYYNELLNRSLIQPAKNNNILDITTEGCRVHDIVLDLIHDLSAKENFVTILDEECASSENITGMPVVGGRERKVRRLSIQIQQCLEKHIPQDTMGKLEAVRSLNIIHSEIEAMPVLSKCHACRVLSIGSSSIRDLNHLSRLLHLRKVLPDTLGSLVPMKILHGAMPSLESLDFTVNLECIANVEQVPTRDAIRNIDFGLGNLLSLREVVVDLYWGYFCTADIKEVEATVRREVEDLPNHPILQIRKWGQEYFLLDDKVELEKKKSVELVVRDMKDKIPTFDQVKAMQCYPKLEEISYLISCKGARLSEVAEMEAALRHAAAVHPKHPTLVTIFMRTNDAIEPDKVSVREWKDGCLQFDPVKTIQHFDWREEKNWYPKPKEISFDIDCEGASLSEVEEMEEALRHAAAVKPSCPVLLMTRINEDKMGSTSGHCDSMLGDHDDSASNKIPTVPNDDTQDLGLDITKCSLHS
ncbi:hypothetical protein ACP4OV_001950 [Aristida adscensionis]